MKALDGVFAPERDGEVVDDRAHLPALDGLRGLAVLLVVMLHLTTQIKHPTGMVAFALKRVFFFGWSGVDLFFVLSGFLITGILVDAKGTSNYFRVFYARRMLRILPLYYGALLILFVVPHLITAGGAHRFIVPIKDQLWYWFYLQNFHPLPWLFAGLAGHFWTLAIEEQFYLVWPLVILLSSPKTAIRICVGLVVISIGYRILNAVSDPSLGGYASTFGHLDGLAVGSALAIVYRSPGGIDWVKRRVPVLAVISGMAFVGLYRVPADVRHVLQGTFIAIFYACVLAHAAETGKGLLQRFFRSRVMRFFGRYSYGMYVLHIPLISGYGFHDGNSPGTAGILRLRVDRRSSLHHHHAQCGDSRCLGELQRVREALPASQAPVRLSKASGVRRRSRPGACITNLRLRFAGSRSYRCPSEGNRFPRYSSAR